MVVEAGIWLFSVDKCGYYSYRDNARNAPPVFGGLADCLSNLKAWSQGRKLSETSTYEVAADSDGNKAYLVCLERAANGDYLVGLWNKIQTNSNKIASVGVDDLVGQAVTEFTEIDEDRIPGHATYFLVMPNENRVATVRVKHATNGLHNFQKYIGNFMQHIDPQHVVLGDAEDADEIPVVGFRSNLADAEIRKLRMRFRLASIHKPGETQYLIDNSALIQKVICKTTITNLIQDERNWWQKGLDIIGLGARLPRGHLPDEVLIKTEMPMTFEQPELKEIIATWEADHADDHQPEEDIGFVLRGEATPRWLSRSYSRKNFGIDLQWLDEELVDPQSLLHQLQIHRAEILALG
jgi:hypothetical protein